MTLDPDGFEYANDLFLLVEERERDYEEYRRV